jgi:DNA-binding transcriptional LysR family regulator
MRARQRNLPDVTRLEWDQVRVFLAVMRAGHLQGASKRLGLDLSTVSRRLDRLETELGVHLFDRSRQGTAPTALAEAMLPPAETMERAWAEFSAARNAVERTAEGVVRLTAPPGVADAFIAPLLAAFHQRFPRVRIELDATVGYADLTRREADLALRAARPKHGDLLALRLVATRALPLTSPAYAEELGTVKDLSAARWITWGADLAHLPTARWWAHHAAHAPPVLRTSHFATQLRAAAAGLGVVLAAPAYQRVHALVPLRTSRALKPVFESLPEEELWLVGHRALREVPRIAALWEFLAQAFRDPAATAAGRSES